MLSINTNLSSLIAQNSMQTSTNKLNQAIERMTTGAKINHAKDNAANYSINTNMTTKISAYDVAADNVAMGMDMVSTASDTLSEMQNHAERLRALATQARNGTYGGQSLNAIQSEADAITKEIERLYNTAQYNGVKLFSRKEYEIAPHLPQAGKSGFIDEGVNAGGYAGVNAEAKYNGFIENPVTYTDARLAEMLASGDLVVLETDLESFTSGKSYLIKDKAQLEYLAELVNSGKATAGVTFILGADIDLKGEEWTPIGNNSRPFRGIFDGNGHKIKKIKIDNSITDYQGLFGYTNGAEIKNISLEGGQVEGNSSVGILVGYNYVSSINNCYVIGNVTGQGNWIGGLVGNNQNSDITNCYSSGNIIGGNFIGGLIGTTSNSVIKNCYANGSVIGRGQSVGGIIGCSVRSSIINCYSMGSVLGENTYVGGLIGEVYNTSSIRNCYSATKVSSPKSHVGGLIGSCQDATIANCYSVGNTSGKSIVGGLFGTLSNSNLSNSYASGDVFSESAYIGGLAGRINSSIDCEISDCAVYGKINSSNQQYSGSLVGSIKHTDDGVNFSTIDITNCQVMPSDNNAIGCVINYNWTIINDYDMSAWLSEISDVKFRDLSSNLQVGVHGNDSSRINFNTNFKLDLSAFEEGISSDGAFRAIDDFINLLSEKQTKLGSVSNRLDSVLDEILIQQDNLVASRSTIRDADIAEVSSTYIQQQILQDASATLLASTKNIQYQNVLGLLQGLRG